MSGMVSPQPRRTMTRREKDVTAKNANGPAKNCRRCKMSPAEWVAVDINRYVEACVRCFDSAAAWAALCPMCEALMCEHKDGLCPQVAVVRVVNEIKPAIVRELTAKPEDDIIDVEIVDET